MGRWWIPYRSGHHPLAVTYILLTMAAFIPARGEREREKEREEEEERGGTLDFTPGIAALAGVSSGNPASLRHY